VKIDAYSYKAFRECIWGDRLIKLINLMLRSAECGLDNYSETEPDVVLLEPKADFYASGHPQSQDVFLIVEVADSRIKFDGEIKVALYGENNVVEVWLVDINEQCLEVYRQPICSIYQEVQKLKRREFLSVQRFSDINIQVDEILG
jgi:Uma2 family endonuclease